ncbi:MULTISPECIES: hypothetical protein [unclassified Ruegeria]|uniref:hypothetical protein n=1 Tax=unclassified Ruegeria TaxID=2625375 RepID=UPI001488DACA|nr:MULTISPECIES: hypothetical protein [unclassified Ruegeria]NOD37074.1 hypothetical protein [Ruegeria sp. HKCCD7296]NOD49946.1 hypothetical protein [Ruegeria sp. HKCCD5849]NOD54242.1 hypothetical protein [Ruegeria sp. HKCCD5851]NOD68936.1 hypothetical protein [Ruegeria sp. HKCCD7303]NOE35364.1 hypothetical protein [Ruegeria sp. HKCCD7318]
MRFLKVFASTALVLAPAIAEAVGFGLYVRPQFRTEITALPDGVYEVKAVGSSAPVNYWCGIGDYAIRTLGVPNNQRIYIYRAYEPGVRTVQFSLTPPPGADTKPGYSITVRKVGANMSASSAQNYCYDNFIMDTF